MLIYLFAAKANTDNLSFYKFVHLLTYDLAYHRISVAKVTIKSIGFSSVSLLLLLLQANYSEAAKVNQFWRIRGVDNSPMLES